MEVLAELRPLVPYECAELAYRDPVSGELRPLVSVGYCSAFQERFHSERFEQEADELGMHLSGRPVRIRDVPEGTLAAETVAEVLLPAGFREGLSECLVTREGRYVGVLNVSTCDIRHPSDEARDALWCLNETLANVVDVTQSLRWLVSVLDPEVRGAALTAQGALVQLPGRPAHPLLAETSPVVAVARELVADRRREATFLWHDAAEGWHRVHVLVACGCAPDGSEEAIVTIQPSELPYGLTSREVEVLSLLARGRSNREIADELVVSPRTVSTHVERILEKLGVSGRSGAAALAVREGLLVEGLAASRPGRKPAFLVGESVI